jgi:hypothetical protein
MWAMMEKLRMFFINKLKTKKSGTRPGRRKLHVGAIQKKRRIGADRSGRTSQASALSSDRDGLGRIGIAPKLSILPDFSLESPVSGGRPQASLENSLATR